jgi:hypothetical protein
VLEGAVSASAGSDFRLKDMQDCPGRNTTARAVRTKDIVPFRLSVLSKLNAVGLVGRRSATLRAGHSVGFDDLELGRSSLVSRLDDEAFAVTVDEAGYDMLKFVEIETPGDVTGVSSPLVKVIFVFLV